MKIMLTFTLRNYLVNTYIIHGTGTLIMLMSAIIFHDSKVGYDFMFVTGAVLYAFCLTMIKVLDSQLRWIFYLIMCISQGIMIGPIHLLASVNIFIIAIFTTIMIFSAASTGVHIVQTKPMLFITAAFGCALALSCLIIFSTMPFEWHLFNRFRSTDLFTSFIDTYGGLIVLSIYIMYHTTMALHLYDAYDRDYFGTSFKMYEYAGLALVELSMAIFKRPPRPNRRSLYD